MPSRPLSPVSLLFLAACSGPTQAVPCDGSWEPPLDAFDPEQVPDFEPTAPTSSLSEALPDGLTAGFPPEPGFDRSTLEMPSAVTVVELYNGVDWVPEASERWEGGRRTGRWEDVESPDPHAEIWTYGADGTLRRHLDVGTNTVVDEYFDGWELGTPRLQVTFRSNDGGQEWRSGQQVTRVVDAFGRVTDEERREEGDGTIGTFMQHLDATLTLDGEVGQAMAVVDYSRGVIRDVRPGVILHDGQTHMVVSGDERRSTTRCIARERGEQVLERWTVGEARDLRFTVLERWRDGELVLLEEDQDGDGELDRTVVVEGSPRRGEVVRTSTDAEGRVGIGRVYYDNRERPLLNTVESVGGPELAVRRWTHP